MNSEGQIYATRPEEILTPKEVATQREDEERLATHAEKSFDEQIQAYREIIAARRKQRGAPEQEYSD